MCLDGAERQIIKNMDGNNYRPKIKYCSICDPFVLILREDDTIGLFIVAEGGNKIRRKDMSPMGEKVRFFTLCGVNVLIEPLTFRHRVISLGVSSRTLLHYSRRTPMAARMVQTSRPQLPLSKLQ